MNIIGAGRKPNGNAESYYTLPSFQGGDGPEGALEQSGKRFAGLAWLTWCPSEHNFNYIIDGCMLRSTTLAQSHH